MIAIGGVIGTGLFLGTANALKHGGPLGLWLGYCIIGSVCYAVMQCLGEMIAYLPVAGGHITLAKRFVNPSLAFTMGWNYWYNWVVVLPAELSAAAVLISFWDDKTSPAVWISVCLVVCVAINMLGVRAYGESEFWFCSIKILCIVGLIILAFILDLGGGPSHDRLGFRYWKDPGPLAQYNGIAGALGRFLGFWSVLVQASFSFIGTEIVGMTAGESKNPRKAVPSAIRKVWIRILFFYVLGTLSISVLVPHNHPDLSLDTSTAAKSPFVIAIKTAGIKGLPSVINACLVTSATSAASSDMYTSSRALYSLALAGQAPRIFARTTKGGLPYLSLFVSFGFALLSYMGVSTGANKVFNWFANMTSICGLLTWFGIVVTYVQWEKGCRAQGVDRKSLPYTNWGGRWMAYYAIFWTVIVNITNGWPVFLKGNWDTATFVTSYFPLPFFAVLYFGHRFTRGTSAVAAEDMDFVSGIREIEAEVDDTPVATTWYGKALNWIA
ncbi:hypothetical protein IE53DRAFT_384890 [Violaceomyces palustris]|uniref:Uncharacterized protein n=1 Tax=Violaceomyces palustris TaxID=1673888 RepID=A0ACD0P3D3_9BASI|nr:hypothetical protein IE53DRAFT_384890 [Violaceomyces palustris]